MTEPDFSDLRAVFVGCTLKPSPQPSHTEGLMRTSADLMRRHGVTVDEVRAVDHDLAPGVWPDMREHGAASDGWPDLFPRILAADILVLGTPIWLGDKSSVATRVVERLYAMSGSSTMPASTRTTAGSAAWSSQGTRTAPSTSP